MKPEKGRKVVGLLMLCPRCNSKRIQRGYKDAPMLLRLGGRHELLCNNCGFEFKRFNWSGKFSRLPAKAKDSIRNRRLAPRYSAHLPATIRLVEKEPSNGELSYSVAVLGHCKTISGVGMGLSFIGSRIDPANFENPGRLLMVVISLPDGAVKALVKIVTSKRSDHPDGPANWFVGTSISRISEADRTRLAGYLERRSREEHFSQVK